MPNYILAQSGIFFVLALQSFKKDLLCRTMYFCLHIEFLIHALSLVSNVSKQRFSGLVRFWGKISNKLDSLSKN